MSMRVKSRQSCSIIISREGVRGVAGVALATSFFRFYFIILSKKFNKKFFMYYRLHQFEIPNALPELIKN